MNEMLKPRKTKQETFYVLGQCNAKINYWMLFLFIHISISIKHIHKDRQWIEGTPLQSMSMRVQWSSSLSSQPHPIVLSLSLSLSPTHLLIEKNTRNKMIVLEAGRHAKKQNECRCPSVWGASSAISSTKQDQDENPGIAKSLVTIVDLRCVCVRSIFYAILNLIQKKYIHIIFKSNFEKNRENLSPKQKVWLWWTNK